MASFWRRIWFILRARWLQRRHGNGDSAARARDVVARIEPLVHEAKTAAASAASQASRLRRARSEQLARAEEWAHRASEGVDSNREDLAVEAVRRELGLRRSAEDLDGTIAALDERSASLYGRAQELSARLDDARLRLRELSSRRDALAAQGRFAEIEEKLEDPWGAGEFDRLREQLDHWEAEVRAAEELTVDTLRDEIRSVAQDLPEVRERLDELRRGGPQ